MSIDCYVGCDGPTINVATPEELLEAIDLLHTQAMDNIADEDAGKLLPILEDAMEKIRQLGYE